MVTIIPQDQEVVYEYGHNAESMPFPSTYSMASFQCYFEESLIFQGTHSLTLKPHKVERTINVSNTNWSKYKGTNLDSELLTTLSAHCDDLAEGTELCIKLLITGSN